MRIAHQAALPPGPIGRSASTNEVNVRGHAPTSSWPPDAGVQRVVHASSSSVYGESHLKIQEEDQRPFPTPLAVSARGELTHCGVLRLPRPRDGQLLFQRFFGLPGRSPTTRRSSALILPGCKRARRGPRRRANRQIPFVTDVVQANLLAAKVQRGGRVFNVGSGDTHAVATSSSSSHRYRVARHPLAKGGRPAHARRISARPSGCWAMR